MPLLLSLPFYDKGFDFLELSKFFYDKPFDILELSKLFDDKPFDILEDSFEPFMHNKSL